MGGTQPPNVLPLLNQNSSPGSCFINLLEMLTHRSFLWLFLKVRKHCSSASISHFTDKKCEAEGGYRLAQGQTAHEQLIWYGMLICRPCPGPSRWCVRGCPPWYSPGLYPCSCLAVISTPHSASHPGTAVCPSAPLVLVLTFSSFQRICFPLSPGLGQGRPGAAVGGWQ